MANARSKGLSHYKSYSVYSATLPTIDEEETTDEEVPDMNSCSEDESSSSDSDSSDDESDDDSPIPQVNNVKAEDSEDDDYEDDDYEDDTAPAVNIEYKAPVVGRTSEHKPPRFDVSRLRPFEVMFADEKEYDMHQRGGWTTSFILLDLASDAWFKVDATRKTSHPDSPQQIVIQNGIHLLTYPRTLYTDGCGSMKLVRDKSIVLGSNNVFIPPYTQSLNEAERIADRAFAAGRTHLASTNALPTHMALVVDMVCYMKLRMDTTELRSPWGGRGGTMGWPRDVYGTGTKQTWTGLDG